MLRFHTSGATLLLRKLKEQNWYLTLPKISFQDHEVFFVPASILKYLFSTCQYPEIFFQRPKIIFQDYEVFFQHPNIIFQDHEVFFLVPASILKYLFSTCQYPKIFFQRPKIIF